ncbi:vWA domain-containing protein [Halobellus ruber]|uniref:VWA domain-containing protein n=1 Tax=Halobellus ruber TaxID=2761102 RepID=A0A7J9SMQ4_9EURY|nr:vWA domain-containing protein [Halobellus ruber]MBB6647862.1 VWA domain-containing protein [Halobellus ruber]
MDSHITFVLDSSGSMAKIRNDTIGGFNSFLEDQRTEEGSASVSLYEFNTNVETIYEGRRLTDAEELDEENYVPGGQTALYDAIVTAIDGTNSHLASLDANEPDSVVVVVLTDGKENASETSQESVQGIVEYWREEFKWEFLFIGANQDAALTAERMGMDAQKSLDMDHSGEGAEAAYDSTSARVSEVRSTGHTDGFDESDRKRQEEAGDSQ